MLKQLHYYILGRLKFVSFCRQHLLPNEQSVTETKDSRICQNRSSLKALQCWTAASDLIKYRLIVKDWKTEN